MKLAALSASILLFPAGLAAQDFPRWLVDHRFVDARSGAVVGGLVNVMPQQLDTNRWLGSDQFLRGESVIDIASERMIDARMGWLALRKLNGKAEWAIRALASFREGCAPALTADRVVFASLNRGGLNGLDRRSGKVVWRHADCPCDLFVIDDGLVIGADMSQPRGRETGVSAFALEDGKPAFELRLPEPVHRIVATDLGIALLGSKRTIVYDRQGAEQFRLTGKIHDMRAGENSWFVVTAKRVEARDRTGHEIWSHERVTDDLDQFALTLTPKGEPLIWRHHEIADSGMGLVCRDPKDGSERWSHRVRGLGVSKVAFPQNVQVRCKGNGVYLQNQASGVSLLVELDASTGAERGRRLVERQ